MGVQLEDFRWLVSAAALPWLQTAQHELSGQSKCSLASRVASGGATIRLLDRLRRDLSAERAHLVVEQVELRQRAREKFTLAERMYFTRQGLEQATDEALADWKAARFPSDTEVFDLCCGIGGDLAALAKRAIAMGVDVDPALAVLAQANVALLANKNGKVVVADACGLELSGRDWHCDPDRRSTGRRSTRGELFQPPLEALARLLQRSPSAAIKLAPATVVPADWSQRAELEWLGSRGECRQQVAWFGTLARHAGQRSASVVEHGAVRTVVGTPDESLPVAQRVGRYVYEPHAAVLAAKLTNVLCHQHRLAAVAPAIGYLTGDEPIDDVALAGFEVADLLPLDRKRLQAYCHQRGLSRLEIKKRGVEIDPERLRKAIVGRGDNAATLILTPQGGQVRAIVAQRMIKR